MQCQLESWEIDKRQGIDENQVEAGKEGFIL